MVIKLNGKDIVLKFHHGAPPSEHAYRVPGFLVGKDLVTTQAGYLARRQAASESSSAPEYIGPDPLHPLSPDATAEQVAEHNRYAATRDLLARSFPLEPGRSPYGTMVEIVVDSETVATVLLRLHPKDNFCRREGRKRALKTALSHIQPSKRFIHSEAEALEFWQLYETTCKNGGRLVSP